MLRLLLRAALTGACAAGLVCALASGATADDPFYKGKRLNLMINFAPGGPTDIEGRLLARYLASTSTASRPSWCRTRTAPAA